ncbi:polymorphic toxin-type HINT domain-containing protein [Streptomyces zagrosensis]|uniref:RHS repeat-associated protein n=1 Tax=Streptomyces zagrosensis TaxID=1042984 RepID=A0A7W9V1P7_9ACTN|nr:polymorphic toxin-type HINT domain-containing protein [Streptomyces zagrosensis]MBB5938009.1 RHS repeat-associated protein [Streptomyces zagrosensis]
MNDRFLATRHRRAARRKIGVLLSVALLVGLVQATGETGASAADDGSGRPDLPRSEKSVPGADFGKVKPRPANAGPRTPSRAPRAVWPKAGSATVRLPAANGRRSAAKATPPAPTRAGTLPVFLMPTPRAAEPTREKHGQRSTTGTPGTDVTVRVEPQAKAERAGVSGVLLSLTAPQAGASGIEVDYAAFAEAYGGGYLSRLTLVQLPACALTSPDDAKCRTATPVASVNDTENRRLKAASVPLRAGVPTVLAAMAGDEGKTGDYKASTLSPSASWQTDLNTGDFGWSYPMEAPDVPGDLAPDLGLSYSSGALDGRTSSTNNQASWVGDGFDLSPGFIERRYKPCYDDGVKNADGREPGDLCWGYDNAYLTLNGKGGELVPTGKDEWKLRKDDGTRITRLTSGDRANGDNDNEFWRLTDTDGTQYFFGYHRLPGWASGKETTDSTWTVPVYGDDANEPCHKAAFADSWCQQGWRWNLDYVVDVHGNAMAYYYDKETNSYGRNLKDTDDTPYTRGGYLDRIEYGLKSSDLYKDKALARVDFAQAERCLPQTGVTCAPDTIDDKKFYWYDTPWDLNCKAGTTCDKGRLSPSFFTRKRLVEVSAEILKGTAYAKVDSWALNHRWGEADVDRQLLLDSVQHTGHAAATAITLPKTTFAYTQLENRLDKTGDGYAPYIKARLSSVADEYGGQVDIAYSAPDCSFSRLPTPQSNTGRCFPQFMGGSNSDDPERHYFNKYVVTSTTGTDRTGGAPDQVTRYAYLGDAAWHFDDDDGMTKEKFRTWSQWRGYGHVRVNTGGQGENGMKTQEEHYFLRGMDGDREAPSGGTKDVNITLGAGEGAAIPDHASTAGFEYKTVTFSGPGGKVLEKAVERPWHHQTAQRVRDWGTVTSDLTGTGHSKQWTSLDDGAGQKWRTTEATTSYDTVAGRITRVDDAGDTGTSSDDRCTRTTYADNTAANLLTLPAREEAVAAACDATPDRAKDVISDVRTAYDGGAYGAAPTKGNTTATATLKSHDGTKATYLESGHSVDGYGRVLTETDLTATVTATGDAAPVRQARSDGRTTTTAYAPTTGHPTKITETTPPATPGDAATAQTTTTDLDIATGQPTAITDTNGNATEYVYDALGRTTKVWLADRSTTNATPPNYEFTYTVTEGKAVAIGTKTLENGGRQRTTYQILDGLLRERQTQEPGPGGGRVLADVFYDDRGLPAKKFAPYYAEGNPRTALFAMNDALSVETQTWHTHDGLGRETEVRQIAGNGDGGKVLSATRTLYGGDRSTVIPPEGASAVTTVTDARDQTMELRQHHARSADAAFDTTRYTYTPAGKLAKVTDPAGNAWGYGYDQLGQQIRADDPDKGTTHSRYDDRGQLTSTTDARGTTLVNVHDGLGRKTELRESTTTGTLRAKWVYDTVSRGKGQLAESTRYVNGHPYTSKVTFYDRLYRALKSEVVIPETEGALAGTYHTQQAFDMSGLPRSLSFGPAGSQPGVGTTFSYEDGTLRPIRVNGDGARADVSYTLTGKPQQYAFGLTDGQRKTWTTHSYEWGTQRLASSRVDREDVPGVDRNTSYHYDQAGNVTSLADVSRDGTDNQCFAYDHLRRLTQAWTQPTATCAQAPSGGAIGGPAPYWQSYSYDKVGNRLTETEHDLTGAAAKDTTRTYAYPAPGQPRPHTLTSVATKGPTGTAQDTYDYDEVGNTRARTLAGDTQNLTWDAEGHLAEVTEPVGDKGKSTTSYVYDADGNRLIGRTDTETTLYLGPTEVTLAKGADKAKATRYLDLGGGHQAVVHDDRSVTYTLADHHGTGELAITATDLALTQRRNLPFGAPRGTDPTTWPGSKGFVGGTKDTTTGLTHLGAREYDPKLGRFISVDPVMDLTDAQQMHGYTYGNNNPLLHSDPSGMWFGGSFKSAFKWAMQAYNSAKRYVRSSYGSGAAGGRVSGQGSYSGFAGRPVTRYRPARYRSAGYRSSRVGVRTGIENAFDLPWSDWDDKAIEKGTDVVEFGKQLVMEDFEQLKDCSGNILQPECLVLGMGALPVGKLGSIALKGVSKAKRARQTKKVREAKDCHSFLPSTMVLLADGSTRPIKDVKTGDKVLVTNRDTGETAPREVVGTIVTDDDKEFVDLKVAGAEKDSLIATATHPFWVENTDSWVDAGDITAGMRLRTPDGSTVQVASTRHFSQLQRTHDLTVAGVHTYYVVAGGAPVLVHNSDCDDAGRGLWRLTKEGSTKLLKGGPFKTTFHKSASDGTWWTPDVTGHGESAFKVYRETSKGLEWISDADKYGDYMPDKWKGDTGKFIPNSNLRGVKR